MFGFAGDLLIAAILFLYPTWRIFRRAGLAPALSLIILIPGIGWFIALFILAFATWPNARATGSQQVT